MSFGRRISLFITILVAAGIVGICGYEWTELQWAHSSFDNYYSFRGCTQLLSRTSINGVCKTSDGQTIEIVSYKNKWYLNGDLPHCTLGLCF